MSSVILLFFINDLSLSIGDALRAVDLYTDDMTLYDISLDK